MPNDRTDTTSVEDARRNVNAWLRVHTDACRCGDDALRRKAIERIAFWTDKVLGNV